MPQICSNDWDRVLALLEERIQVRRFETWIRPIVPLQQEGGVCVLGVPGVFFAEWLGEHHQALIEETISTVLGEPFVVRFEVLDEGAIPAPAVPGARSEEVQGHEATATLPSADPLVGTRHGRPKRRVLHSRHTFEEFVVGKSNDFAIAAALAVVEHPGVTYNPLFIYGGCGLGKTHILHAVAERVRARQPEMRVVYCTSEQFMLEMIRSIRKNTIMDFKRKYREVDVLLVDDIQFLKGKESTQEEFFHTFNSLFDSERQLVITADCAPHEIHGLEDRLSSRFASGLVCDVQPPDFETRVAILRKFADYRGIALHDDVALMIATNVTSNIRELEGCLNRLHARAERLDRHIDVANAKRLLGDLFSADSQPAKPTRIMQVVCSMCGVDVKAVTGKRRTRLIARPRQLIMYLLRQHTSLSLAEIGQQLGGRDHSTVLHAVNKIAQLQEDDPETRSQLAEACKRLGLAAGE